MLYLALRLSDRCSRLLGYSMASRACLLLGVRVCQQGRRAGAGQGGVAGDGAARGGRLLHAEGLGHGHRLHPRRSDRLTDRQAGRSDRLTDRQIGKQVRQAYRQAGREGRCCEL